MNPLTARNNSLTLDAYYAWSRLVKKGFFMKGTIKSTIDSVCSKCKSKKFKNAYDEVVGYSIPRCVSCQGIPTKFKISRIIPDETGKGKEATLYRGIDDQILTKISDCLAMLGRMDNELVKGTYKVESYNSKTKQIFKFSVFAEAFINNLENRGKLPEAHDDFISPGGKNQAIGIIRRHLIPYFKDSDIREITKYSIIEFNRSWVEKFRTRDMSVAQLKTMLRMAYSEMSLISSVPVFPKIKKSKEVGEEEIPEIEIQARIIQNITTIQHRELWTLIACFAKRSCEGRAWQVQDWDSLKGVLKTQRHFSNGGTGIGDKIVSGRKSIKKTEKKGVELDYPDAFLSEVLNRNCQGKKPTDFIFNGENQAHVHFEALNRAWRVSCKKLDVNYKPYCGTKHSTVSSIMIATNGNLALTSNFSGHTNVITMQRYGQTKQETKRELVNSSRFRE